MVSIDVFTKYNLYKYIRPDKFYLHTVQLTSKFTTRVVLSHVFDFIRKTLVHASLRFSLEYFTCLITKSTMRVNKLTLESTCKLAFSRVFCYVLIFSKSAIIIVDVM